jgi:alpha-D-xyloside xylohydrolase
MKTRSLLLSLFLSVGYLTVSTAAPVAVLSVHKNSDGVTLQMKPGVLRLEVFSPRIIRVTYGLENSLPPDKSLAVIGKPERANWKLAESADEISLRTDEIETRINRASGAIEFFDKNGNLLLAEKSVGGRSLTPAHVGGIDTLRSEQEFALAPDEAIYGLGQHAQGLMNYRRASVHLQQRNPTESAVPVLVSSRSYGVLWDNPAITDVDVGKTNPADLSWTSEAADTIDYYFMFGPELDGVVSDYRDLTGAAPMFGKWAFGFWQCRERYRSQQELLDVAGWYRTNHVPLDGIIQDWQYWTPNPWGSHKFDTNRYHDPVKMMQELHAENVHAIISIWPKFDVDSPNADELRAAAALYPQVIPYVFPKGQGQWYDAFNPVARKIYWRQVSEELFADGLDGWWLDASEPELSGKWGEFRNFKTADGPGVKVLNAYPLMHMTTLYQGQRGKFAQARFHSHALGLRRTTAQFRRDVERRHSRRLENVRPANSRRFEFFHQRHSVLEHRHRRFLWRPSGQSRRRGTVHTLVSIRRFLPDVSRPRLDRRQ